MHKTAYNAQQLLMFFNNRHCEIMLLCKGIIATYWIPVAIIALHCFVFICHCYMSVIPEPFKRGYFQEADFILVGCIFHDKMLIVRQYISCIVLRSLKGKEPRKRGKKKKPRVRMGAGYNGKMGMNKRKRIIQNTVFSRKGIWRCKIPKKQYTRCRYADKGFNVYFIRCYTNIIKVDT